MHEALKDSLLNEENSRQINEMNAVYEKDKQQQRIGELTTKVSTTEEKAEKNRQLRNFFLLSSVFLLFMRTESIKRRMHCWQCSNRKYNKH